MFERYTENARRSIFFARWEASQFGSGEIEPEHLLFGLMRHTQVISAVTGAAMRAELEPMMAKRERISTSLDLPLSPSVKRAMAHAAEDADKLGHQHIGVEHLLLGLMAEDPDSIVPGLLRKHGIDREMVLRSVTDVPGEQAPDRPARMGGMLGGGIGRAGTWGRPPGWKGHGRRSATRFEDGAEIVETHHLHDGHEITVIERFRLSEDGKTLSWKQEIFGPGRSEEHAIDFDVSKKKGEES